MDIWGIIGLIALIVIVVLIGIVFTRVQNLKYRTGKGMFEHSEYNMDEEKEFSDKEYYDGDKGLFK